MNGFSIHWKTTDGELGGWLFVETQKSVDYWKNYFTSNGSTVFVKRDTSPNSHPSVFEIQ